MAKFLNKKILILFTAVVLISFFGKIVLATPPISFYEPGEEINPTCLPTDINCDMRPPLTALNIDDTAYGVAWDTDTTHAPSKNALYDKIEGLVAGSHDPVTLGTANGLSLATQVLSLGLASTSTTGALSDTDWDIFNNKAPALGVDDNYVTDAEKTVIGNTSGTNTGDNAVNTLYSGLVSSQWTTSVNDIYYNTGNVGIGTTAPTYKLEVNGTGYFGDDVTFAYAKKINFASGGSVGNAGGVGNAIELIGTPIYLKGYGGGTTTVLLGAYGDTAVNINGPGSGTATFTINGGDLGNPGVGNALVLRGGNGNGPNGGGKVYVYGGLLGSSGSDGDVILAHTGSAARGNVGIGTSNPDSKLTVNGGVVSFYGLDRLDRGIRFTPDPANNNSKIESIGTSLFINDINFQVGGSSIQMPATGGFIGYDSNWATGNFILGGNLGATVVDQATTITKLTGQSAFAGATTNITGGPIYILSGNGASASAGLANGGNIYLDGGIGYGTGHTGYILLGTTNNSNVGIGTTSPAEKLHVAGNIRTTGSITVAANEQFSSLGDLYISAANGSNTYFRDGSSTNMFINNTGNVGIGTTSPGRTLQVAGTGMAITGAASAVSGLNALHFGFSSNTGSIQAIQEGSAWRDLKIDGKNVILQSVNNTGNVGIGTTAPAKLLHVSGSATGQLSLLKIQNTSGFLNDTADIDFANTSTATVTGRIGSIRTNRVVGADSDLTFSTFSNSTLSERMRIRDDGNVGIGTTAPGKTLDVYSSITDSVIRTSVASGIAVSLIASSSAEIHLGDTTTSDSFLRLGAFNGINNIDTKSRDFKIFSTAATTGMTFQASTGNVGIGTTGPSYLLDVNGSARVTTALGVNTAPVALSDTALRVTNTDTTTNSSAVRISRNSTNITGNNYGLISEIVSTSTTNIAGYFTATGGTNNYGLIVNAGNVGIGTTSPTQALDVVGAINASGRITSGRVSVTEGSNVVGILSSSSVAGTYLQMSNSNAAANTSFIQGTAFSANLGLIFQKIGIGPTAFTPGNILSLDGTLARTIWMERNTTASTAGQGLTLSSGGAIAGTADLAGGDLTLSSGISTGNGTSAIHFLTATAGVSAVTDRTPTEKMTILGNGNVGIGTTAPGNKLDISGSVGSAGSVRIGNTNTNSGGYADMFLFNDGSKYFGYQLGGSTVAGTNFGVNRANMAKLTTTANNFVIGTDVVSPIIFGINGAEKVRIDTNGNVGIGTTAPGELLSLGLAGTTKGVISLAGNTSGKIIIQPAAAAGSYTLTLPTGLGAPGSVLTDVAGNGVLSWAAAGSGSQTPWTSNINAAGYTLYGNSTASGNLTLNSTSNATKGNVLLATDGGNVGIGAAAPLSKLYIADTSDAVITLYADTDNTNENDNATIVLQQDGNFVNGILGMMGDSLQYNGALQNALFLEAKETGGTTPIQFVTGGTTIGGTDGFARMTILSGGNIGVGETAPGNSLVVRKDDTSTDILTASPQISIDNRNTTNNNLAGIGFTSQDTGGTRAGGVTLFGQFTSHTPGAVSADLGIRLRNAGTWIEGLRIKSDGKIGIGTTAPGAHLDMLTAQIGSNTIARKSSSTTSGSAGAGNQYLIGDWVELQSGYTGPSFTSALVFDNNVSGTDATYYADTTGYGYRVGGNRGAGGYARGNTTGHNIGGLFLAGLGDKNYGVWGASTLTKNSATNVGIFGSALNGGTSSIQVGGYFTLLNTASAPPIDTSAALVADNGTQTSPIFLARDNSSTVFSIIDGGNVGIGTTSPGSKLSIVGDMALTSGNILVGGVSNPTNAASGGLFFPGVSNVSGFDTAGYKGAVLSINQYSLNTIGNAQVDNSVASWAMSLQTGNNDGFFVTRTAAGQNPTTQYATLFSILSTGNVGIGDTTPDALLDVKGTVCLDLNADDVCTDNTSALSDSRLKTNVTDIQDGLDLVRQLHPVRFTWNGLNNTGNADSLGFLAQEVEMIFPELVLTDTDGYKNLDYSKLTAVLAKSIQELDLNINALTGTITPLAGSDNETFVTAFFNNIKNKISTWLADATNGVTKIFTGEIETKTLCVSNENGEKTCITKEQLDALLINAGTSTAPAPTPDPVEPTPVDPTPTDPDPTPVDPAPIEPTPEETTVEVTTEPEQEVISENTPEVTPEPEPEPTPEPTPEEPASEPTI